MAVYALPSVTGGDAVLTTEHAASSYGQPVLVWHGRAHGPCDPMGLSEGSVMAWRWLEANAEKYAIADNPLVVAFVNLGRAATHREPYTPPQYDDPQ